MLKMSYADCPGPS